VCRFCEKPDLLSRWRAYGAQAAGYSVGFDGVQFAIRLAIISEACPSNCTLNLISPALTWPL
jgi:hypothetical protein